MLNITEIRALDEMPFDKAFENSNGNEVLCHATGYEVCMGNPLVLADWWNEYVDPETDELYYGR